MSITFTNIYSQSGVKRSCFKLSWNVLALEKQRLEFKPAWVTEWIGGYRGQLSKALSPMRTEPRGHCVGRFKCHHLWCWSLYCFYPHLLPYCMYNLLHGLHSQILLWSFMITNAQLQRLPSPRKYWNSLFSAVWTQYYNPIGRQGTILRDFSDSWNH